MTTNNRVGIINVSSALFIIMVFVFCITASDEVGSSLSLYKYAALALGIINCLICYSKKCREKQIVMKKEFKFLIFSFLIIMIFSLFMSLVNGIFSFRTIQEMIFLVCPVIYAFLFINLMEEKEIHKVMKLSFIIVFCFYFFSLNLNFSTIVSALKNSSFENSSSNLESSIYSGFSLAYCFYFCYFDKNRLYKYFSVLFVFMTFKRISIIVAVFLFILSATKLKNWVIRDNKIYNIVAICIIFISIFFYICMLPENVRHIEGKYNIDISKITSTRSQRLKELTYSDYKTYGFGSTTNYMSTHGFYGNLEMDIIKMIIELGYIPVIVFVYAYLFSCKNNFYLFFFMITRLLSLIITSSLASSFSWVLIFIGIFAINKSNLSKEGKVNECS